MQWQRGTRQQHLVSAGLPVPSGKLTTTQAQDSKVVNNRPFFARETEQALLLAQLRETPDNMLLILGPRSSGKSRLLREVLLSDRLDTPVSWFSGREQKLSDASVMTQKPWRELDAQLNALEMVQKGLKGAAETAISLRLGFDWKLGDGSETLKLQPGSLAAPASTASSMNMLNEAYDALLAQEEGGLGVPAGHLH